MTWLTAAELAALGLPDWPGSEFRSRARLAKLGTPSRIREGSRGGGGREYDTSTLPTAVRRAVLQAQLRSGSEAQPTVAPETALPAHKADTALALPAARPPSKAQSACADARVALVNRLHELAQVSGMTHATQALSRDLAEGLLGDELLKLASAANQRPRDAGGGVAISARTLFRWVGDHRKGGWQALLPKPTQAKAVTQLGADVLGVMARYAKATGAARVLSEVTQEYLRDATGSIDGWEPLYNRVRRALPKVDQVKLIKARHRGAERAAKLPFKRRLTETLAPNDVWLVDGHTFKAKVRHPDHGQPFAPEVTMAIDAATRKVVGWSVSLSENVMGVAACLRHGIATHGVPGIVYTDNGAGETAKQLDCPVVGMYARLGIDHRTGIPGHPQGHGLKERSWRTHMIRCARQFATYQGADADSTSVRQMRGEIDKERRLVERSRQSGDVVVLSARIPSWGEFLRAVEISVARYNAEHRHSALPRHETGALAGKRLTPDEAWPLMAVPDLIVKLDDFAVAQLALPSIVRTAKRGEVEFLSRVYYGGSDLMQVDGQRVRVDYDLLDASRVWVWTLEGEFVCQAAETRAKGGNGMAYFPQNAVDAARYRRVQATEKLRTQQIETARRELQTTLPAPLAEFQVPAFEVPARQADAELPMVERVQPEQLAEDARPGAFDSTADRYEWLLRHRDAWSPDDSAWLRAYAEGAEYAALRDYYASRGIAWPDDPAAFNAAG